MTVALPEETVLGLIELLVFVADLCADQHEALNKAIYRFTASSSYAAGELNSDATDIADLLAQALGFADASLEPVGTEPAR